MILSAMTRPTHFWRGRLGGFAALICCASIVILLTASISHADTTSSSATEDVSSTRSDQETTTSDAGENDTSDASAEKPDTKEQDPGESSEGEKTESEAEESQPEGNEEQPGDKDASVEEERPQEEEPPEKELQKEDTKQDDKPKTQEKHVIGATATLMEKKSEIVFRARIDTGAKSCSLHVEQIKIDNESETMADNIGKVIHFQLVDSTGKTQWLKSKVDSYVIIKTSNSRTRRYKVPLTFQWKNNIEKKVLVTLNNRNSMEYPLLVGRNFLRGDFVVDVEMDSND